VSPEDPDGTELSLEPDEYPAARPFKQALVEDGIPFTSFATHAIPAAAHRDSPAEGSGCSSSQATVSANLRECFDAGRCC
jgi:hypothetical protein